ncbi:unnamed protein product [Boreogadus saida]
MTCKKKQQTELVLSICVLTNHFTETKLKPTVRKGGFLKDLRPAVRSQTSCPESGQRSGVRPAVRSQASCPESDQLSGVRPAVRSQASCPESGQRSVRPAVRSQASCPESGQLSGVRPAVRSQTSCPESGQLSGVRPAVRSQTSCPESGQLSGVRPAVRSQASGPESDQRSIRPAFRLAQRQTDHWRVRPVERQTSGRTSGASGFLKKRASPRQYPNGGVLKTRQQTGYSFSPGTPLWPWLDEFGKQSNP